MCGTADPPSTVGDVRLRTELSRSLTEAGFTRSDRRHTRRIDRDFSVVADVGISAPRLAPWVGLRHDPTQEIVSELIELTDDGLYPTVGSNVGYVVEGTYLEWTESASPDVVEGMVLKAIERVSAFASLDLLPEIWSIPGTNLPGYHRKLAVIAALSSRPQDVARWLAEGERLDCAYDDEVCEHYRVFRRNFEARFGVI